MLNSIDKNWLKILDKPELKEIEYSINQITKEEDICPPKNKWFEWARLTKLNSIKIIIIGQDPYPTEGIAHGLAFSSLGKKIPGSLQNIYKCLNNNNIIKTIPNTANLTYWAEQGVLLLNTSLSTEKNMINKHTQIWIKYMNKVITDLSNHGIQNNKKYTYLLWGNHAKKIKTYIDNRHHILEWLHPSPLSQVRATIDKQFINCDHFTICKNKYNIDWDISNYRSNTINNKNNHCKKNMCIRVFTDGSCINNGKKNALGGFAAIFVSGTLKGKKMKGRINGKASNIRAEGKAIRYVLKTVYKLHHHEWNTLKIYTDSLFWIDMIMKYMPKWTNDKFNQKSNSDLTKSIWKLWNSFPNHKLYIIFVPAHDSKKWSKSSNKYEYWCYYWNNEVDKLAFSITTE